MLILASASPRRAQILTDLGVPFRVVVPDTDETLLADDARGTARRNAGAKFDWCRRRCPDGAMVAADTVIDFEGRCLVKPASRAEAVSFLQRFSGKTQTVITAVALGRAGEGMRVECVESLVTFKLLELAAIEEYFRRVDPMDKAGAYDINQSRELIIAAYAGSWTNIMGLPVEVIVPWLEENAEGGTGGMGT